jgi:hypothetical protein
MRTFPVLVASFWFPASMVFIGHWYRHGWVDGWKVVWRSNSLDQVVFNELIHERGRRMHNSQVHVSVSDLLHSFGVAIFLLYIAFLL